MTVTKHGTHPPSDFDAAIASLRQADVRPEVVLERIPAPARLAPHALALSASVNDGPGEDATELATGRFILLHDPAGQQLWQGTFRIVTYLRAELDAQMGNDQLLGSVAWTWLVEALTQHRAAHTLAGGTATRVLSENFGALTGQQAHTDIELRASWTPTGERLRSHLEAWIDMVASFAGLPPLPEGVTPFPGQRLT